MKQKVEMKCPVCNDPAREITESGGPDSQIIECMVCGTYEITGTVLAMYRWETLPPEGRKDALLKAKRFASPRQRPTIDSHSI